MKRLIVGMVLFGLFACGSEGLFAETLLAGRTESVGTVEVTNDEDNLCVVYSVDDGWGLEEAHLHVDSGDGDSIPTNKPGNPKVGRFEYKKEGLGGVSSTEFEIFLEDEGAEAGEELTIAAHAVVRSDGKEESAWAEGERFRKRGNWAMFFTYTVQDTKSKGTPEPTTIHLAGSETEYTVVRTFTDKASPIGIVYNVARGVNTIEFSNGSPALGAHEEVATDTFLIRAEESVKWVTGCVYVGESNSLYWFCLSLSGYAANWGEEKVLTTTWADKQDNLDGTYTYTFTIESDGNAETPALYEVMFSF